MKKKILITNDDGFDAPGLLALVDAIKDIADVTVVAPSTQKSACGHSLTLTRPLRFISIDDDFYKLDDGTPSDCVYLALHSIFDEVKPDLLISGINYGSNMGEDITYSGTCAGAMEGTLHNIDSIAISQVVDFTSNDTDYSNAAKYIRLLVLKIFEKGYPLSNREFINVNIPKKLKNFNPKITYAGYRYYANDAHLHRNPRAEEYYWLGLHPLDFKKRDVDGLCDYNVTEDGYISLTPVKLDMTSYNARKNLEILI